MEEDILKAARWRTSAAEVYSERSTETSITFKAGKSHSIETRAVTGFGLRVICNDRIGFSSTTRTDRPDDLALAAIATSGFGEQAQIVLPGPQKLPTVKTFNNRLALQPVELMIGTGNEIVDYCRQKAPDMKVDLTFSKVVGQTRIMNTSGLDCGFERTVCSLEFEGLIFVDSRMVWITDFLNLSANCTVNVRRLVDRLVQRAEQARRAIKLETRTYPCIFTHFAALDLLSALLPAVNGKNLEKNITPLKDRENKPVLDEKLTIWDDPLRDYAFNTAPFDGEGLPRQKLPIFQGGVFRNYLLDLKTAAALGRHSTAGASRTYRTLPVPGASNLVIDPGTLNLDQTIADMKDGLLIYAAVGGGQTNLLAGDFSLNVNLGYKVERGEIVGRVKNTMVAGNIYDAAHSVIGLGETQYDFGSTVVPFIYFPGLPFAAAG